MPDGKTYGNLLLPSGFHHIQRFGPSQSALAQFLYPFAWLDVIFVLDHFIGGSQQETGATDFNEATWQEGNSANGTGFAPPSTQLAGGVTQGVTGAYAGDTASIWGDHIWLGDRNCGMQIRWKCNNNDNEQIEMGFADPLTDQKLTAINNIATPTLTNAAVDVALVGIDTGASTTTMRFITDGSTGSMDTTGTNLGTRTPTNGQYQSVRVQLAQTASAVAASHAYVFDENNALQEDAQHGDAIASQIKGDVLLGPLFLIEALTNSARTVDIDLIAVWMDAA